MAFVKGTTTYNGFETYTETIAAASAVPCSAITNEVGGDVVVGIQTSTGAGAADTNTTNAISLQISADGTTWATIKQFTAIALAGSGSRGFNFDLTGIYAPYIRVTSALTTSSGNGVTYTIVRKKGKR